MVEPITSVPSHVTTLHQLAAASVDVLAHYFVLEHVRDTDGFLRAARRALAPGGLMICEVPDLHLYPQESSALLLHEHVSHFSPESLSALAARYGFAAVEISHRDCSRPFGFAGVFSLAPPSDGAPGASILHARSCVEAGVRNIERYQTSLQRARERLSTVSGTAAVWAANPIMADLVHPASFQMPENVRLVDPSREDHHARPSCVLAADVETDSLELLVICTPSPRRGHHRYGRRAPQQGALLDPPSA